MPAISIIVPVYNVEQYLHKCVDSILAQTFTDYEIILVNDGSTDQCREICEEYTRNDRRVRVINKKNGGLSDARNFGIHAAKGNYLGFVDSDDWIEPHMFESLYNLCIDHNAEIGICSFNTWEQVNVKRYREHTDTIMDCGSNEAIQHMYKGKLGGFPAWNKLYKNKLFESTQFPKGRIYEDAAIMYKLYDQANKIVYIDRPLYNYIHRVASITRSNFSEKRFDIVFNYYEANKYMQEKYPEMCEKLNSIFFDDLRRMVVDIINERSLLKNYHYLGNISSVIRENSHELMKNNMIPLRHKIIAQVLARGLALGVLFYKMRIFTIKN